MNASETSDVEIDRRVARRVFLLGLGFLPIAATINASSLLTDAAREGFPLDPRLPWVLEFTSVAVLVALVPLVALIERRFPLAGASIKEAAIVYAAGSILFTLLHVAGLVVLRSAVFPVLMGTGYRFFEDPFTDLVYEYRKDLLPYAMMVLMLTLVRAVEESERELRAARREARSTGRLTLKSGGRTIFLQADAVLWARAAGNYVEIHVEGRTHLPRISLTALQQQLRAAGVEAVQVHRSHIVNRAAIVEVMPAGDGDFTLRLADGTTIRGSRRFRDQFPSGPAATPAQA